MHGYWYHDWRDEYHEAARFDVKTRKVWPKPPSHIYGYREGQRFYFLNILEELDQAGEWFLDRKAGVLYFWPPSPVDKAEITFPEFERPMLVLKGANDVEVRSMTFECSRNSAILVKGGSDNTIAGCTIRNVGNTAIRVIGGTRHTIRSCDLYEVASTTIAIDVRRNGKWVRVFESRVLALGDDPQQVSADITGADQLRLITTDGGDGIACDHAVWANARVH